jgi:hypothetical protein
MIPVLNFLVENLSVPGYLGQLFGENLKGLGQFQNNTGSWPYQIVSFQPLQILCCHRHLSMQLEWLLALSLDDSKQVTTQISEV